MFIVNESKLIFGWLVGRVPPHKLSASFVVKGTFDIVEGKPASLTAEQDQLAGDVPDPQAEGALRYAADLVPLKVRQELLLVGTAHAPGGKPATQLPVQISLGPWSKLLVATGDRGMTKTLLSASVTEPAPFVSMPLGFNKAYGGADFEENPAGCGRNEITGPGGQKFIPVPNVLRANEVTLSPRKLSDPAGFGPLAPAWPQRMNIARRASFDKRWLKEEWPGYPRDFDWTYFNAAPKDQTFPPGSIRGDETITLVNLRPEKPSFAFKLPGLRPRWFVNDSADDQLSLREVALVLDTIWIDAENLKLVVLWRGVSALKTKRMLEVRDILIDVEPMAEKAREIGYYLELLRKRKAEKLAMAVEEGPPEPQLAPFTLQMPEFDWGKWEAEVQADNAKAHAMLNEPMPAGQDPMKLGAGMLQREGANPAVLKAPSNDPATQAGLLAKQFAELKKSNPAAAARLGPPPTADELDPVKVAKKFDQEFEATFGKKGPPEGEAPAAGEPEEADDPPWTRERVVAHAKAGGKFDEQDLSGLDLSGLELKGLSFKGAVLESANLAKSVLGKSNFHGATMTGAILADANLDEAVLDEVDLTEADLTAASLLKAALKHAVLQKAKLAQARLEETRAFGALFMEADFAGVTLRKCDFSEADFSQCKLEGLRFDACNLSRASAYGAKGAKANFEGSNLRNFRSGEGADFSNARFVGVDASESVWGNTRLVLANFSDATLFRASFEDAQLDQAVFIYANLREARLSDVQMNKASAGKANFFRATFEGSSLNNCDLRGANLYEAEFLDATVKDADLSQANKKGTKLA